MLGIIPRPTHLKITKQENQAKPAKIKKPEKYGSVESHPILWFAT